MLNLNGERTKATTKERKKKIHLRQLSVLSSWCDGRLADATVRRRQVHRQAVLILWSVHDHRRGAARLAVVRDVAQITVGLPQVPVQKAGRMRVAGGAVRWDGGGAVRRGGQHRTDTGQLLANGLVLVGRYGDRGRRIAGRDTGRGRRRRNTVIIPIGYVIWGGQVESRRIAGGRKSCAAYIAAVGCQRVLGTYIARIDLQIGGLEIKIKF